MQIDGTIPEGDVIMASCDSVYFDNFAVPLIYSANEHGNDIHIHIINPSPSNISTADKLKEKLDIRFTYTTENTENTTREYYSCNRFLVAPHFLKKAERLFIIDTDCLIMKKLEFPNTDLGLFLRTPLPGTIGWEYEGTHVAAGTVMYTKKAIEFAEEVASIITSNPMIWFLDQVALWRAYCKHETNYSVTRFTQKDMDWDFKEETSIWTGKGSRKYENQIYCAMQQKYRSMHVC